MKPIRSSFNIVCLLLVLLNLTAEAQPFKRSRVVSRSFPASRETELQLSNKYGDINLIPWEKDSIVLDIIVSVVSNKQAKADKTFNNIDFDFKATRYYVIAKTLIDGQNQLWSDVSELTGGLIGSGTSTSILYTVYYPNTIRLTLENKFGDIFLAEQKGRTDIKLANGNLKAHSLLEESTLYMYYAKARINQVEKMKLTLSYSDCQLGKADNLTLDSRASTLNVEEAGNADLVSRRDKIKILKTGICTGHLTFSNCTIGLLNEQTDLQADWGNLSLQSLSKNMKMIRLQARSCNVSILLNKNNSYKTNLQYTEVSEVLVPTQLTDKKISDISPDKKTKKLECVMGDVSKPPVELDITTTAGSVDIKF